MPLKKITPDTRKKIFEFHESGKMPTEIGRILGLSRQTIHSIIHPAKKKPVKKNSNVAFICPITGWKFYGW